MRKVTLDTNCLYELESNEATPALRRIVDLVRGGKIAIQIPAIAASERQPGGGQLDDFGRFRERISRAGLESAVLLRPLGYVGLSYVGWALTIGPDLEQEERHIHNILFPKIAFRATDHCTREDADGRKRWRNAKCDVQAVWCHIHHGGDIFVTRDQNFLKQSKKSALEKLGAGIIANPEEAVNLIGLQNYGQPV